MAEPERYAYDLFMKNRHLPGSRYAALSPGTALGMYDLFLNGRTLREIWDQNQNFGFGQVVHAAVEGGWVHQRAEYLNNLFSNARLKAQQAIAEGASFVGDAMAAAHKLHGAALRKYLQTGNPDDIGAMGIGSLKQYKDLVDLMMKLTGSDQKKQVEVSGTVEYAVVAPTLKGSLAQLAASKKISEMEAQEALDASIPIKR